MNYSEDFFLLKQFRDVKKEWFIKKVKK
jgi:hypothetical protein